MAAAAKKPKIERDEFTPDGVRMFNASKPHGVVYCDGFIEVKFIQEYEGRELHYRGDRLPVGYVEGQPLPPAPEEISAENVALKNRIKDLEDSQRKTNELLEKLLGKVSEPKAAAVTPPAPEPMADGASKRK